LNTVNKSSFDETIDFTEPRLDTETLPKEFDVDIIKEEQYEDDLQSDFQHDNDSYSDNDLLTIDLAKLKRLDEEEQIIKKETRISSGIKKQSIRRYESKATVKKLDVDMADLKSHCVKIVLSETEIEELLERDKGHRKLPNKCSYCKRAYRRNVDLRRHETFNHVKVSCK
jgi:hypothetical protein